LAQTIATAHAAGAPLGELARLQRYQRARKTDNLAMMAVVEGFKRLYEPVPLPVMWLRNWGMQQVNSQPWLKNKILKYAMGLG
jgi:2-octaprenylphenol hydroxylase